MSENTELGGRIRRIRDMIGISQSAFAKEIGTHRTSIGRYESGETAPDGIALMQICTKFGVSGTWLLTSNGPMMAGEKAEGEKEDVSRLSPHVQELKNEIQSLRKQLTQTRLGSSFQSIHEEADFALLARRGSQLGVLELLLILVEAHPSPISLPALMQQLPNSNRADVQADLLLLQAEGLLSKSTVKGENLYFLNYATISLHTHDVADGGQLLMRAIGSLVHKIGPAADKMDNSGIVVYSKIKIAEGRGLELQATIKSTIKDIWKDAAAEKGGEEVVLVLGMATQHD